MTVAVDILEGAVEVADRRDADSVFVALSLYHNLAAEDRPSVKGDAIDTSVSRWPCLPSFQGHRLVADRSTDERARAATASR